MNEPVLSLGGPPVRVVHICRVKGIAGAERHLLHLLPALAREGLDVRLVVIEERGGGAEAFRAAAAALAIPSETIRTSGHVDPLLVARLAGSLRRTAPDVVHTHLFHGDLYGLAAASLCGLRATVSSRHDNNPFRRRTTVRWLNRLAMRRARRIIAISDAVAAFVVQVEGAQPASVVTSHYGLDVPEHDPAARAAARARLECGEHERLVGCVGRLVPQKGVDVLLESFARLRAVHRNAKLVIVGDGPLRGDLVRMADRLDVSGQVVFAGWVEHAMRVMPAFDVAVVPSRWEGLGLVALEALAWARPLVASRVDALPEIVIDRESGLLVPPGDPAALASAIDALLDAPDWAAALGRAGRERVQAHFTIERMVRTTLQVYRDVLTETGAGSARRLR